MRLLAASVLAMLCIVSAVVIGGTAPLGRLALSLGLSSAAASLLDDPLWRGVALYRSGQFDAAAEAFRLAGPRASFNRGNALAFAGRYEEAVAAYDAVIFRDPDDREAHANRALIAPLAAQVVGEVQPGGRTLAGAGDAVGPDDDGEAAEFRSLRHEDIVGMMRKLYGSRDFDGEAVVASRQWLASLADEPGRYLKLRLAAERERRLRQGRAVAQGSDPW